MQSALLCFYIKFQTCPSKRRRSEEKPLTDNQDYNTVVSTIKIETPAVFDVKLSKFLRSESTSLGMFSDSFVSWNVHEKGNKCKLQGKDLLQGRQMSKLYVPPFTRDWFVRTSFLAVSVPLYRRFGILKTKQKVFRVVSQEKMEAISIKCIPFKRKFFSNIFCRLTVKDQRTET